jgi:hypothetical protein
MSDSLTNLNHNKLVEKWSPVLEGISDQYTAKVTAILLENQAKSIVANQVNEAMSDGATTTGRLGTFQKFAFPLVRRVFPELIFNKIGSVQPMEGPVSQIFYLGSARQYGTNSPQPLFSKYNLTYRGQTTSAIGTTGTLTTTGTVNTSALFGGANGSGTLGTASTTYGGQIAMFPTNTTFLGWAVSAGERLDGTGIPELNISIEQQPVVARTKKMRALWTIEASQDLKAYHNLDLERELTELMSKELELEIDRELLEDIRGIAYNIKNLAGAGAVGGWVPSSLDNTTNSNNFGALGGTGPTGETTSFTPGAFTYGQGTMPANDFGDSRSNVFIVDLTTTALNYAPQHAGHVYSNLLAVMNFASQDIYKTTHRGPGNWIITSPLVGAMLESASKLEGGIGPKTEGISNMGANKIEYRGKFAGKYDLFIDPLWPEDEILMGYKGGSPMDGGFVYCPYIPIEALPTITDPETFQPRKGILTRYAKAAVQPANRFYRVIRLVGPAATYLYTPFIKTTNPS